MTFSGSLTSYFDHPNVVQIWRHQMRKYVPFYNIFFKMPHHYSNQIIWFAIHRHYKKSPLLFYFKWLSGSKIAEYLWNKQIKIHQVHDCPPLAPKDYLVWDIARTAKKEHDAKGRIPPCILDLLTNGLNNIAARELSACFCLLCNPIYKYSQCWTFQEAHGKFKTRFLLTSSSCWWSSRCFFNRALIVWSTANKLSLCFWFLKLAALMCLGT